MGSLDKRPVIGSAYVKKASRFLLVCYYDPNGLQTISENIKFLADASAFDMSVLNLWPGTGSPLAIPKNVDLDDFAGVIIHPTVAYFPHNLTAIDRDVQSLKTYRGVKVILKQDEHYRCHQIARFIGDREFDLLLTCLPPSEWSLVYPKEMAGDVAIMHMLTGYVTPVMRNLRAPPAAERSIDISYRGSIQPLSFGQLGYEKRKIGDDVARHPAARRLRLDISSRWEDRISGPAWYDFLGRSRGVLGAESGATLFDFEGEVEQLCKEFAERNRHLDPLSDAYYELARKEFLHRFEGNGNLAVISPRHFEAAATRTLQILYPGTYSGIFEDGRHYVTLERDLSNIESVIDVLMDEGRRRAEIVDAAYEEIVLNKRYWQEAFVHELDAHLAKAIAAKARKRALAAPGVANGAAVNTENFAAIAPDNEAGRILVLCAHKPEIDPRIGWMANSFPDCTVCELGTYHWNERGLRPKVTYLSPRHIRVAVERTLHESPWLAPIGDAETWERPGLRELQQLALLERAQPEELWRAIGASYGSAENLDLFRSLCRHFVNSNSALYQAAKNIGRFDCIINADLESLPAAVALRSLWSAFLVFDSHEYWPYSYTDFRSWEYEFWSAFERKLVQYPDVCVTVSDTLARQLSADYDREFLSLPNAATLKEGRAFHAPRQPRANGDTRVRFLVQGNFAAGRGMEQLVSAWTDVPDDAVLLLRGPDNPNKAEIIALAKLAGLLDRKVFFPPAVREDELIAAAADADVGLIPYDPVHYNNLFACPNKLSQYMAAGLPILTNNIQYVARVVSENGIGYVADFNDRSRLIAVVSEITRDREGVAARGRKARQFFETAFNWDVLSRPLQDRVRSAVTERRRGRNEPLDFSWIAEERSMMAKPITEEDVVTEVLSAALSESLGSEAMPAAVSAVSAVSAVRQDPSAAYTVVRFLWRRLPQSTRHRIAEAFLKGPQG